ERIGERGLRLCGLTGAPDLAVGDSERAEAAQRHARIGVELEGRNRVAVGGGDVAEPAVRDRGRAAKAVGRSDALDSGRQLAAGTAVEAASRRGDIEQREIADVHYRADARH